jgi:hypothetical protein
MSDKSVPQERRGMLRQAALMRGQILTPQQPSPVPCVVRDVSRGGAKLQVHRDGELPAIFWLRLQGDPALRGCTAVWRDRLRLGVAFFQRSEGPSWLSEPSEEVDRTWHKERRAF